MPRVILHERIADYTKKRLLRIQELSGMSRGQILDDIIWLAERIIENPDMYKNVVSVSNCMDRILSAIKAKKGAEDK
jgi:hypothetical protein